MDMDPVLLSRIQFTLTIMFHYLFPPLTIGMGVVLVYLEGMYLRTKKPIYESAAKFWTQIFALNFAIGVVSGIVMEFEFGTNWANYSRYVGDVFGAALAAEGIFAFFLESGFLAVLVFGWDKVSPRFHFLATIMVALGSIFSAVWIIVANSWQQTPAGHHIVQVVRDGKPWFIDGQPIMRAELLDFWGAVFNPSTVERLTHTLIGAFIMGAFFIMSISAYYILRRRHEEFAHRSFTGGLIFATVFSILQLVSGHSNANMIAEHQPAKLAAFEGHFETGPADLSILGWPNAEEAKMDWNLAVPGGVSFLVANDFDHEILGLDRFPREFWPPVALSFASYHVMVGLGMFFILLTVVASVFRWRGKLYEQRWLMWVFVFAVVLPVAANQLGWVAAEVGRQPWIVHPRMATDDAGEAVLTEAGHVKYLEEGLLTREGHSEAITAQQITGSIVMFGLIYLLLAGVWIYVLNHKIHVGPQPVEELGLGRPGGFAEVAATLADHRGSLTEAKDESGPRQNDNPQEGNQ